MNRLFYMILCILISTGMAVGQSSGDNQGITMKGKPVTLLGTKAYIGEMAPDFTGIDSNMKEVKLSDFKGKVVVLSVFPSVDTKVCAARRDMDNVIFLFLETTDFVLPVNQHF